MSQRIITRPMPEADLSGVDDLSPLMQRIYASRGVLHSDELQYTLGQLLDIHQLSGMADAVRLLFDALVEGQRIVVVGDFDVDGATGTALTCTALRAMGAAHVGYYVPNRFADGYGLTPEIVPKISPQQPDVLITVDNGVSSVTGVAAAKAQGWRVLVTDHHLPGEVLPEADAMVNPNLSGDPFPSKALAGVGVIFYVLLALRQHCVTQGWFKQRALPVPNMAQYLDWVALGTVADLVPLDHNNRILVQQGMQRMRAGRASPGIQALLQVAGRDYQHMSTADLGFALGPRLNAAGRLEDMSLGVQCLLAESPAEANALAARLDVLNKERRAIESDMKQEAYGILDSLSLKGDLPWGLCLYDAAWHQGVVGLVASKVKDLYHRPVIVFADAGDGYLKGSGRSIRGMHLRDVLATLDAQHPGLMQKFGGHAMAAGLSLKAADLDVFRDAFDVLISKKMSPALMANELLTDGELSAQDLHLQTAALIAQGGPWGQGFEEPVFHGTFKLISQRLVGGHHLKMTLQLGEAGPVFDGIAFQVDLSQWPNQRCRWVKIAYQLDINRYMGSVKLQLLVSFLMDDQAVAA